MSETSPHQQTNAELAVDEGTVRANKQTNQAIQEQSVSDTYTAKNGDKKRASKKKRESKTDSDETIGRTEPGNLTELASAENSAFLSIQPDIVAVRRSSFEY